MKLVFAFYRLFISPFFHALSKALSGNPYSGCKFEPTCSCYCEAAIKKHGFLKGSFKSIYRISRCHPFSGEGGYDPV